MGQKKKVAMLVAPAYQDFARLVGSELYQLAQFDQCAQLHLLGDQLSGECTAEAGGQFESAHGAARSIARRLLSRKRRDQFEVVAALGAKFRFSGEFGLTAWAFHRNPLGRLAPMA